MRLRVSFYTLGCKLNQLETESIAGAFVRFGAEVGSFGDESSDTMDEPEKAGGEARACPSDLVVINTCTVTSKAEQKARRIIRLVATGQPDVAVIITGCYAQVDAAALAALGGNTVIIPGEAKEDILDLPRWLNDNWAGHGALIDALRIWEAERERGGGRFAFDPECFVFHSRPSLKIQDGCDNRCSYCRVCIARGPSVSLDPELALSRARSLEDSGRTEIVLTGVNLSQYRWGELDFPGLLEVLVAGTERIAFRLSSYEPDRIDERFLSIFSHRRIRPHLHLAVQSGADPVLKAMGRRYLREDVLSAVRGLRSAKTDPFLGADMIVGFPGESEDDAAATLELAETCDFAWIHAFRFSPRPGTRAARLGSRVPERVAGERSRALAEIARRGKRKYTERWIGAVVEAVIESAPRAKSGDDRGPRDERELPVVVYATSENYLKLEVEAPPRIQAGPGDSLHCRVFSALEPGSGADAAADYVQLYNETTN